MANQQEMCYLPTWPLGFPRMGRAPGHKPPSLLHPYRSHPDIETLADNEIIFPDSDEWIRPQPKCVRRFAPHEF